MSRFKIIKMKNLILGIFAAVSLASCTATTTAGSSKVGKAQPSLNNTKWTLADTVKGTSPTLQIEGDKITGNGGCNNYFGTVTADAAAGNFSAGKLGSTRKACPNMSVESNYMEMLQKADKYVINGNTLELYQGSLLLLKFNKQ